MPPLRCKAIVLYGRDQTGNRAGLIPPRQCNRAARKGDYCGLHERQADLQGLLRQCMTPGWPEIVRSWEDRRRREDHRQAEMGVGHLADLAERTVGSRLAGFLRLRRGEIATMMLDMDSGPPL